MPRNPKGFYGATKPQVDRKIWIYTKDANGNLKATKQSVRFQRSAQPRPTYYYVRSDSRFPRKGGRSKYTPDERRQKKNDALNKLKQWGAAAKDARRAAGEVPRGSRA